MTSRTKRALLHAASAAPLPLSNDGVGQQPTINNHDYTRSRRKSQQPVDEYSPQQGYVNKAKQAELDLARQQIRTLEERIMLAQEQLHAQQAAAEHAARQATHNQALLLNKLAMVLSEDALHDWLIGVGMLEPEPPEPAPEPAPSRHKRKHDASHTPHAGEVQHRTEEQVPCNHRQDKRRRRLFFGLL